MIMKYFRELSKEDQERALMKLVNTPKLHYAKLCRARLAGKHVTITGCYFYVDNPDTLIIEYIKDDDRETGLINSCGAYAFCMATEPEPPMPVKSHEEIQAAKDALTMLLSMGDTYMFDERCRAYPV